MTLISFARPEARTLAIVVTGTGRSGTGFASRWLTSVSVPCGHEAFFVHRGLEHALLMLKMRHQHYVGDCSWEAAPHLDSQPLRDALVVHQVRHPKRVIDSCMRVPQMVTPHYARYMERHLPRIARYRRTMDRAACRWVWWNRMIERAVEGRDSYFWRVEDGVWDLLDWLADKELVDREKVAPARMFSNTRYNHKHGPPVDAKLEDVHPDLRYALSDQMRRYGYLRWE